MLRAIVVDDEPLSAELIKRYLEEGGEVSVECVLNNPLLVMDEVKRKKPDVVFLDIEMPQRSGLEIAEEITMLDVDVEIVFITAFNAYAVEAFKVNALDYLMKPVQMLELKRVIEKIHKRVRTKGAISGFGTTQITEGIHLQIEPTLKITALGGFSATIDGRDEAIKWSTAKCSELLAYMLFQSESVYVSKWKLMDILWPGKEDEKSAINLRSTVCRLNKSLREHGIRGGVIAQKNTYRLELHFVEVDAFRLEKLWRQGEKSDITLQEFYQLYPGELFKDQAYEWAEGLRTYYMRVFINIGKELIEWRMNQHSELLSTLQMLEYLMKADMYNEDLQENKLAILYQLEGKKAVVKCQEEFEKLLEEEIGVKPTQKLKQAYEALLKNE